MCIALCNIGDEVHNDDRAIKLLGESTVKEIKLFGQGLVRRDPSLQYNIVDARMPYKLQRHDLLAGLNMDSVLTSLDRSVDSKEAVLSRATTAILSHLFCAIISGKGFKDLKNCRRYEDVVCPIVNEIKALFAARRRDRKSISVDPSRSVLALDEFVHIHQQKQLRLGANTSCYHGISVNRCGPSLPDGVHEMNSRFWSEYYGSEPSRDANLTPMLSLVAKKTHLLSEGRLHAYYSGELITGELCAVCTKDDGKYPLEMTNNKKPQAPIHIELEHKLVETDIHPGMMEQ
jgi:hypothetical protein